MNDRPRSLVWLRDDLRLDDNPALAAACATGADAVFLFVLESDERLRPYGGAARWWLHHSLRSFAASLAPFGQRLILKRGPAARIVPDLAREAGVGRVFWNRRYGPAAAIDDELAAALARDGVAVSAFDANLLFGPHDFSGGDGGPIKVFSAFWRRALSGPAPRMPLPAPSALPLPLAAVAGDSLDSLALLPVAPNWAGGLREAWTPGEAGARARLEAFLDEVAGYAARRDFPAEPATSRLSPHLRFGEISPHRILAAVTAATGERAGKFASELGWREFAWHVLARRPDLADRNLRPEFDAFPWTGPDPAALRAWKKGRTGYPIVDAGMRELWRTGWMHNRVRMIVASFLTKHLLVDWRVGEAWFWDTLVDADAASNPFNWQWVAGSGFDAQPFFRIFNPVLQAERFDPDGTYVRRWVPELAALPATIVHRPWEASPLELTAAGVRPGRDYPPPLVDHAAARQRALAAHESMRRKAATGGRD